MLISEKVKKNGELVDKRILIGAENCQNMGREIYRTLNINITGRCNEKCVYCQFSQCGEHKKGKDIDEKLFYRVTEEAFNLGITDVGLYTSGEPFLNPNIYKYIGWCKKLGFPYVYVSTNGILCTPENIKKAAGAGLDSLKFSIAGGTRDSFLKHHGVDAFERVKENIIQAWNYREKSGLDFKLYMFVIVTQFNKQERENIANMFGGFVDEILFSDCIDSTIPMVGMKEYILPSTQTHYLGGGGKRIPCPQVFNRIVVDEAGWLCSCCGGLRKEYARIVNLENTSLKEAIRSSCMTQLRQRHLSGNVDGLICKVCVTGCYDKNDMHAFNSSFEAAVKKLVPVDIREDIRRRFNTEAE